MLFVSHISKYIQTSFCFLLILLSVDKRTNQPRNLFGTLKYSLWQTFLNIFRYIYSESLSICVFVFKDNIRAWDIPQPLANVCIQKTGIHVSILFNLYFKLYIQILIKDNQISSMNKLIWNLSSVIKVKTL